MYSLQWNMAKYLEWYTDTNLCGVSMASVCLKKSMQKYNLYTGQDKLANQGLPRMLCNSFTKPYLDHACSLWYPLKKQKLRKK